MIVKFNMRVEGAAVEQKPKESKLADEFLEARRLWADRDERALALVRKKLHCEWSTRLLNDYTVFNSVEMYSDEEADEDGNRILEVNVLDLDFSKRALPAVTIEVIRQLEMPDEYRMEDHSEWEQHYVRLHHGLEFQFVDWSNDPGYEPDDDDDDEIGYDWTLTLDIVKGYSTKPVEIVLPPYDE